MLNILSLGAGVQSSVMALMSSCGELEKVDCAIFADTGFEPKQVMDHLKFLKTQLNFPIYIVSHGNLRADVVKAAKKKVRVSNPPFFTKGDSGKEGKLFRSCTLDYKIYPIQRKIRDLLGMTKVTSKEVLVRLWIGMSVDEVSRTKDSRLPWIENYYPLIFHGYGMNRNDCHKWWVDAGYGDRKLPSSSCIGCPFHSDAHWLDMKKNDPKSWNQAIKWDNIIRNGIYKTTSELYLHRSLKPLEKVSFNENQKDFFQEECDGVCDV